jgi:hypothetical protein
VDHLVYEIKSSTTRISELISAVKSYSYMDQAPLQDVNIHDGIESTLTMLQHKLKKADITIIREYESSLPHVNAIGNELNQVWTNLIDNAIDSIGYVSSDGKACIADVQLLGSKQHNPATRCDGTIELLSPDESICTLFGLSLIGKRLVNFDTQRLTTFDALPPALRNIYTDDYQYLYRVIRANM